MTHNVLSHFTSSPVFENVGENDRKVTHLRLTENQSVVTNRLER